MREDREREIQRKLALQEWHARKRENDPKHIMLRKQKAKMERSKSKKSIDNQNNHEEIQQRLNNATQEQRNNIKMLQDFENTNNKYLNQFQSQEKMQSMIQNQNQ